MSEIMTGIIIGLATGGMVALATILITSIMMDRQAFQEMQEHAQAEAQRKAEKSRDLAPTLYLPKTGSYLPPSDSTRPKLLPSLGLLAVLFLLVPTHAKACNDDSPICVLARTSAPTSHHVSQGGEDRSEIAAMVSRYAQKHGVPTHLAHGVIKAESGYRCNARNPSGARGIGQVLPATARSVGVHGNLLDCGTGLEASMRYLRQAIDRGGHGCAGVSLYERGIFARPVCSGYGRKVMRLASAY